MSPAGLRALAEALELLGVDAVRALVAATPPAPATAPEPARPVEAAARPRRARPTLPAPGTAAELVERLVERHGSAQAAASRFGFSPESLGRWRRGAPCSPGSLARLRAAVASPAAAVGEGQEAQAPAGARPF